MPVCPMCKKAGSARQCQRCGTDLSLLADFTADLRDGVARAETLTRRGELGEAVWAYLEVLEGSVDPKTAHVLSL